MSLGWSHTATSYHCICKLETVSIAEPLYIRQHARKTPNAVNTRREWQTERVEGREGRGQGGSDSGEIMQGE